MNGRICFKWLEFQISEGRVFLVLKDGNGSEELGQFVEVQVAGENKPSHEGIKLVPSSEGSSLRYFSHEQTENSLSIVQKNDKIAVTTEFRSFKDTNAVQVTTEVENLLDEEIVLEEVSAFLLTGLAFGARDMQKVYLYKFTQSHHGECLPRKFSLYDLGLFFSGSTSQKRIAGYNVGSWSTKEELPQGIVEYDGVFTMFQIECNHSWYWEISDWRGKLYLYLSGANACVGDWCKSLKKGEKFTTVPVSVAVGSSLNGVLNETTKYRRHIAGRCAVDEKLPAIFNEYMHLSWDSPSENTTAVYAPVVAKTGVEYYVVDCGWHNEEPGSEVYPYVGQWKESKARFPSGLRKTTDFIRSLGMKAGLWIEPEIVGCKCREMLEYYDDECFIRRHGKKVLVMGRYFLDYRNARVIEYMTESIRRMVEDYGADYIKMDYNQDMGVGTETDSDSFGEGLQQCARAFLAWVDGLRKRFPNVLFEACSSGGMRMDYETLKHFSIVSTSDQVDYKRYPYIAGNILSAVLPEQAAVWSYPVSGVKSWTEEGVEESVTEEVVILNMINSLLGRMHLASHLEMLSEKKLSLVCEGVRYHKALNAQKREVLPYFPFGFTDYTQNQIACGLIGAGKIYLAVWNLGGNGKLRIPIKETVVAVKVGYPEALPTTFSFDRHSLTVEFTQDVQARFFELEIKEKTEK